MVDWSPRLGFLLLLRLIGRLYGQVEPSRLLASMAIVESKAAFKVCRHFSYQLWLSSMKAVCKARAVACSCCSTLHGGTLLRRTWGHPASACVGVNSYNTQGPAVCERHSLDTAGVACLWQILAHCPSAHNICFAVTSTTDFFAATPMVSQSVRRSYLGLCVREQ